MKKSALGIIRIKETKYNTTPIVQAIYEAADWLNDLDMLVPCMVTIDARLTRTNGNYGLLHGVKIAKHTLWDIPDMQGTVIHELIHAHQAHAGYKYRKLMRTSTAAKGPFDGYLLKQIEIEAFWWEHQYMSEVHGRRGTNFREYQRLGVEEFL